MKYVVTFFVVAVVTVGGFVVAEQFGFLQGTDVPGSDLEVEVTPPGAPAPTPAPTAQASCYADGYPLSSDGPYASADERERCELKCSNGGPEKACGYNLCENGVRPAKHPFPSLCEPQLTFYTKALEKNTEFRNCIREVFSAEDFETIMNGGYVMLGITQEPRNQQLLDCTDLL